MEGRGLRRASERWPAVAPHATEIDFGVAVARLAVRTREAVEVVRVLAGRRASYAPSALAG